MTEMSAGPYPYTHTTLWLHMYMEYVQNSVGARHCTATQSGNVYSTGPFPNRGVGNCITVQFINQSM